LKAEYEEKYQEDREEHKQAIEVWKKKYNITKESRKSKEKENKTQPEREKGESKLEKKKEAKKEGKK
jgi:hypothetical protein